VKASPMAGSRPSGRTRTVRVPPVAAATGLCRPAGRQRPPAVKTPAQEKFAVALSSVLAAVLLTGLKIVVGLQTGSLGILSEAAHSGLDLAAALVTLLAVRASDKPADAEHLYGHGKIENLAALFETLLLLATCGWIVYEAVERLAVRHVAVDASFWAFAVMFVSIAVDISRSRALDRVARKHHSQALEADALHFRTDIWSSAVVILGLCGVRLAERFPAQQAFLARADALAALGVAFIVIGVSLRLGKRSLRSLIDEAPVGLAADIKRVVEDLPGVIDCHRIRVRSSGPFVFVDVHILVDGDQTLHTVHRLTETVEDRIQQLSRSADVTVHPEPVQIRRPEDPPPGP